MGTTLLRKGYILDRIIDPTIKGEVCPDSLEVFVKVAIQCLHSGPKQRPTMAEVVVRLESALALQEKSMEYYLPEIIITSDFNQENRDFSLHEVENGTSEKGTLDVRNQEKQSSPRITFTKKVGGFFARALSGKPKKVFPLEY